MTSTKEIPEHVKLFLELTPQEMRKVTTVQKAQLYKSIKPTDLEQPAKIKDGYFQGPDCPILTRTYTPEGNSYNTLGTE